MVNNGIIMVNELLMVNPMLVGLVVTQFEARTFTGGARGSTASVTGLSAASQCFHRPDQEISGL